MYSMTATVFKDYGKDIMSGTAKVNLINFLTEINK